MNYPIWLCVSFFAPDRAGTIFSELESATTIQQWANYNGPGSGPFFFQCVRCQRMRQKDFPFRHSNRIEKREKIREKAKSVAVFLWMFFLLAFVGFPSFVQAEWKWLHIWKKIIVNKASKRKFFCAGIEDLQFGNKCVYSAMILSWVPYLKGPNYDYTTFPHQILRWFTAMALAVAPVAKKLTKDTEMRKSSNELRADRILQNETLWVVPHGASYDSPKKNSLIWGLIRRRYTETGSTSRHEVERK